MARRLSKIEQILGARPVLTLCISDMFVREIWVEGRAPLIHIHDYDWGDTDPDPAFDDEGFAFSPIHWRGPAWTLGLSLHPPAKETYTMANQTLKTIPLDQLKVSKLNMRHGRKKPDISDILPSIREHGLRQTLLVREEGQHFGVVAGRRRLFALKQVAKETGISPKVPCVVMQAGDDAAAIEASILENAARLPATEMEQYVAFGRLAEKGRSAADIAEYFGVTELTVRRVLALANLAEPIRSLYADGRVDRDTIRALTLATSEQQAEWLRLFESEDEREPRGRACKAWVTGGTAITTDKALFDLESYHGQVVADLFGEAGVFADVSAFWAAQSAAIAEMVETYVEAGWQDVQVLERGAYFQSWDHQKRPRTKGGKVFVEVRHDGTVTGHEGYITLTAARKLERAKSGKGDAPAETKPEMSGPLAEYINLHRHGAARAKLLGHPAIALRLMVAHAMVGSDLWRIQSHTLATRKEGTKASVKNSRAAQEMAEAGHAVAKLLHALGIKKARQNGDDYHLCEVFAALLGMDDGEVMQVLTFVMADTLSAGGAVVEAVAIATETDMSAYWKPDEAFFDLLRDKRAINAMVADVASPSTAQTCLTETAKAQKEIIANRIAGEGCDAKMDWRPGWMQVPPTRIVTNAGSPPVDAWSRIAKLFEPDQESSEGKALKPPPATIAA